MSKIRYVDIPAIVQVIGCVYRNPNLIDDERYSFTSEDFTEDLHKVVFGSIFNLHNLGVEKITTSVIEDYLQKKPKKLSVYKTYDGTGYLSKAVSICQPDAFNYYYHKMKKMTLLRMYNERAGLDLSWLYDINNIFDQRKKQEQEEWIDNATEEQIAEAIDNKIEDIKLKYLNGAVDDIIQAGVGSVQMQVTLYMET